LTKSRICRIIKIEGLTATADTAFALYGAAKYIDITNMTVAQIQTAIGNATTGETLTVTGSKTGVNEQLVLDIKTGVTVDWQATYDGGLTSQALIRLFDVGGTNEGEFKVTGTTGKIRASGTGTSVYAIDAGASSTKITIDGGEVSASNATESAVAIKADSSSGGDISVINYGIVSAYGNSGSTIGISGCDGDITVRNSAVIASGGGTNTAISSYIGIDIYIEDSAILVDSGYCIDGVSSDNLTLSRGVVLGYANTVADGITDRIYGISPPPNKNHG